jgi:collagen type IV alpha
MYNVKAYWAAVFVTGLFAAVPVPFVSAQGNAPSGVAGGVGGPPPSNGLSVGSASPGSPGSLGSFPNYGAPNSLGSPGTLGTPGSTLPNPSGSLASPDYRRPNYGSPDYRRPNTAMTPENSFYSNRNNSSGSLNTPGNLGSSGSNYSGAPGNFGSSPYGSSNNNLGMSGTPGTLGSSPGAH